MKTNGSVHTIGKTKFQNFNENWQLFSFHILLAKDSQIKFQIMNVTSNSPIVDLELTKVLQEILNYYYQEVRIGNTP